MTERNQTDLRHSLANAVNYRRKYEQQQQQQQQQQQPNNCKQQSTTEKKVGVTFTTRILVADG
jgi:hypothetical protein